MALALEQLELSESMTTWRNIFGDENKNCMAFTAYEMRMEQEKSMF